MKKLLILIFLSLTFSCSQPNSEIYPGITACGDFMFVGQDSSLITYNSYGFESWIREAIESDFKNTDFQTYCCKQYRKFFHWLDKATATYIT